MAEIVTFVRQDQQDEGSQDVQEKIVAEFPNGKYYQIILTPEEQHRCTIDPEYLKEILSKADIEQITELEQSYEIIETKKEDTFFGNSAKWPEDKTLLLLSLVKELCPHTKKNKQRAAVWKAMVEIFGQHGYMETPGGISKKWFNLKDRYKIIKMKKKDSNSEHVTWPYFEAMEEILTHQRDVNSPTENLMSSMTIAVQSTSQVSSPSAEESSSSSSYEGNDGRKQRKKRKKQMTGRSKKRRLRGKANDQTAPHAPSWFTAYLKGTKEERKWRQEVSNIMRDGNNAVKLLAASIAEFARK